MIKIENTEVVGFEPAIRGMRNPKNSWSKSDSFWNYVSCGECNGNASCIDDFHIGPNDHDLMTTLAKGGPVHAKYRRMIAVYLDITAPLYWWKEFDTYKIGTVANSCSTMHKIAGKEFTLDDFSHEHLYNYGPDVTYFEAECEHTFTLDGTDISVGGLSLLSLTIDVLNGYRDLFNSETNPSIKKRHWWQMIQLLPSSYNQTRTVMLNYEVLAGLYPMRKDHKLDEWQEFCKWIESLPYSELITGERVFNHG